MICAACDRPIVEGQHYLKATVELDTRMPDGWKPVVELPNTGVNAVVCNPSCLALWAIDLAQLDLMEPFSR